MDMSVSDSGSSSGSPIRGNSSTSVEPQRPPLGNRRSTLSRQITSKDLDDPMPSVRTPLLISE
jgi:hypothetical protein